MEETKIVLIVGPSGVGKDTLLKLAKKRLKDVDGFNFVKRYITRKPDKNEKNYYLRFAAFNILKESCYFVSHWKAHNNEYGIAKESIKKGVNIISISRGSIHDFENEYDSVTTIYVTIPKTLLLNRLRLRGRETEAEIMNRLKRTYDKVEAKSLVKFDNSSHIKTSVKNLVNIFKNI